MGHSWVFFLIEDCSAAMHLHFCSGFNFSLRFYLGVNAQSIFAVINYGLSQFIAELINFAIVSSLA